LRAYILTRDNGLCRVCGRPASEVDHVVAKARGGSDDEANLQAICSACHAKKTALEGVGG
jgi:5-methylcytosine-specific restriction protein A